MSDEVMTKIYPFFKNGHASHLQQLNLIQNKITASGISKVLDSEHFVKLTRLDLSTNPICDEGAIVLFSTLIEGSRKLRESSLGDCSLTSRYVATSEKTQQGEQCENVYPLLKESDTGDEGVRLSSNNALTQDHCKLTHLFLNGCLLTERCISNLCKMLQDERCQLNVLSLSSNKIGDEGARVLFKDGITNEHCKLTELHLAHCGLTDKCIPRLCKTLQDELCKLNVLSLRSNRIGDESACVLFEDGITREHCKLTELDLRNSSLTDKCIPRLCKALQHEHCGLTKLRLNRGNNFTDDGKKMLSEVEKCDGCKARGLKIE
jgi:Leucine-rich repeat (LRR) protein